MESLLPYVIPYVPGCPEVVVESKILEAAISLCENTNCWRIDQENTVPAETEAETSTITLTLDTGAELVGVPVCKRDDLPYMDYTVSGLDVSVPAWAQESTLFTTAAQRPKRDAESLPEAFTAMTWTDWRQALAEMAKALLHSMSRQAWSDPRQAAADINQYNSNIGILRAQISRPSPMAAMRVQPRLFV